MATGVYATIWSQPLHSRVFTGAGVSTASGIPGFRGPSGVWTHRRPVLYEDFLASEKARIEYWDFKLESWGIIGTRGRTQFITPSWRSNARAKSFWSRPRTSTGFIGVPARHRTCSSNRTAPTCL